MKHLCLVGLLIIAAHCLVAVWQLLLTPMVLPASAQIAQRAASVLLFVVFAVALSFGSHEHFLSAEPNNIFRLSAGPGALAFRISSVLLFLLEVSARVLALYSARFHRNPAPAS